MGLLDKSKEIPGTNLACFWRDFLQLQDPGPSYDGCVSSLLPTSVGDCLQLIACFVQRLPGRRLVQDPLDKRRAFQFPLASLHVIKAIMPGSVSRLPGIIWLGPYFRGSKQLK